MEKTVCNKKGITGYFFILLIFLVSMYFDMSDSGIYYSKIILILILSFLYILKKRKIVVLKANIWMFLFILIGVFSGIYGINNDSILGNTLVLITGVLLVTMLGNILEDERNLNMFLKMIVVLGVILNFYIITNVEVQILADGTNYYGGSIESIIGNRNMVALMLALSVNIVVYSMKKGEKKIVELGIILFLTCGIMVTGSRKGLIMAIVPVIINNIIIFCSASNAKKKIKIIMSTFIVIICSAYLILNVTFLYNTIGFRLEAMVKGIVTQEQTVDGSFNTRKEMIVKGLKYWGERPVMGIGMANFRHRYYQESGKYTYSHNNYIELLVNNGVVGFLFYYMFYLHMMMRVFKKYKLSEREVEKKYYRYAYSLIFTGLILDFALVNYNAYYTYILLGLGMKNMSNLRRNI